MAKTKKPKSFKAYIGLINGKPDFWPETSKWSKRGYETFPVAELFKSKRGAKDRFDKNFAKVRVKFI